MNDAMGMPQSAVVIGGSSEIARAIVGRLVSHRLRNVVLAGRDEHALKTVAQELLAIGAAEVHTAQFDVTDAGSHTELAQRAKQLLGQIDCAIVATGTLGDQRADEHDPPAAASVITTNFTGPAACMLAFADLMRRQGHGRIIVLSSVAGVRVRRANFVYGSSKAGLDGFALGLADSLLGSGVRVTIVRPGWVATRMTAGLEPAPFATTAEAVASDVVEGIGRGTAVVWSPKALKVIFSLLRMLPRSLFRRLPG